MISLKHIRIKRATKNLAHLLDECIVDRVSSATYGNTKPSYLQHRFNRCRRGRRDECGGGRGGHVAAVEITNTDPHNNNKNAAMSMVMQTIRVTHVQIKNLPHHQQKYWYHDADYWH